MASTYPPADVDPGTSPEAGGAGLTPSPGGYEPPTGYQPPPSPHRQDDIAGSTYGSGAMQPSPYAAQHRDISFLDDSVVPTLGRPRKNNRKSSQRPSVRYAAKPTVTRLHMLEFMSQKEWWYKGQNDLCFTIVLWLVFIYIMYSRAGVEKSYNLHLAVAQHMENIIAHPHLSGIRMRPVTDDPLPCRCACSSSSAGMPKGPCDDDASEMLDFLGHLPSGSPRLPQLNVQALASAQLFPEALGDKLEAGNDDIKPMTWDRIAEPADAWFWIEHGFIPDVWRPRSMQVGNDTLQGLVAQKNLIVGGVRVRQKRAAAAPDCQEKVNKELVSFYGMDCRSSEDAKGSYDEQGTLTGKGTTAVLSSEAASQAASNSSNRRLSNSSDVEEDGSTPPQQLKRQLQQVINTSAFLPSTTTEETGVYDALFNVEMDVQYALTRATECRDRGWVDAASRTLNIQSMTLNAEIGMFALIDIEFEFPVSGGVEKKVSVHTFHATGSKIEFIDIVPELIWGGLIGILFFQEFRQVLLAGWRRQCLDYWLDLWCMIDWISICVAVAIAFFWLWQMTSIGAISDNVGDLLRPESGTFAPGQPPDVVKYEKQWQLILDDSISVYHRSSYYKLALFWYNLILASRFLKNFMSQPKLAMLQMTVGNVFWDLCHLFVFFATIFLNFQLGGHILFGAEMEEWSTMVSSGASGVRMMLGNYDFDSMYSVAPFAATCWFWLFLITMVFVLINMIFAMVADYYHAIREFCGHTDTVLDDSKAAVKDLWWRTGWRRINIGDGEIKAALLEGPYDGVHDELMNNSSIPDSVEGKRMKRDAEHTCLGIRLARRNIDAMTVEGLDETRHPGYKEATSKQLQEYGADIMGADHLLELCQPKVDLETEERNASELTLVRRFLEMMRKNRHELDEHCRKLEEEAYEDRVELHDILAELEARTKACDQYYNALKGDGIHSLAPPALAMPRPGTLAAHEAQQHSAVAPGALLRAIDNQQMNAKKGRAQPDGTPASPPMLMNAPNVILQAIAEQTQPESPANGSLSNLRPLDALPEERKRKDRHRGALALNAPQQLDLSAMDPPVPPDNQLALDAPMQPALPPSGTFQPDPAPPEQLALPAPVDPSPPPPQT